MHFLCNRKDTNVDKIKEVLGNRVSRRRFMAGIGAGVSATAAVALASGCSSSGNSSTSTGTTTTTPTTAFTDLDILQFALSLEFLGAEYYLNGLTGSGVSASSAGSSAGAVTGAAQVPGLAGSPFAAIVAGFAQDELAHIALLQSAITSLSGTPVSRPAINFTQGFNGIAALAGVPGGTFNPFSSISNFLLGAFSFEDVDTSAYTGTAGLISSATVLNAAAGIQAVEAYHAGTIRTLIVATDSLNGNTNLTATANLIESARSTLGGGNETTLGPTGIVAASSSNAIGFGRTTDQVLHIVYGTAGGAGVSSGGFFPSGINGTITTTAA